MVSGMAGSRCSSEVGLHFLCHGFIFRLFSSRQKASETQLHLLSGSRVDGKSNFIFPAFPAKVSAILFGSWLGEPIRANACGQGGRMAWNLETPGWGGSPPSKPYGPREGEQRRTKGTATGEGCVDVWEAEL